MTEILQRLINKTKRLQFSCSLCLVDFVPMSTSDSELSEYPETPRRDEEDPEPEKRIRTRNKRQHPSTSVMVGKALQEIGNNRNGISLQAIKKFVIANFNVNLPRINIFINKYIKAAVCSGVLIQTKGKGATGSFKIAPDKVKSKKSTAPGRITKSRAKPKTNAAKTKTKKPAKE